MKTPHPNDDLKISHLTPAGANAFADLGFSPEVAKILLKEADARIAVEQLKAKAATAITRRTKAEKLTRVAFAQSPTFLPLRIGLGEPQVELLIDLGGSIASTSKTKNA